MNEFATPQIPDPLQERLRTLERFLEADRDNARLFADCAALAEQVRDYETLLRIADRRLQAHPGDLHAAITRSRALIGKGDYRSAATVLERICALQPADPVPHQDLGLCYFCLGEFERARQPLEVAQLSGECSSGLLRLLISTHHQLGLITEAEQLAAANPAPAEVDSGLAGVYALLYLDLGNAANAARWAKTALAVDPTNVDALTVEGTLAAGSGALDQATQCFQRALERAPNTGRAWIGLGSIALLNRDLPMALQQVRRGVELLDGHVGSWHVLGWTQLLAGDLDSAEIAFQRALELNRNFAETHGSLAAIAALKGDTAAAQRHMEVAQRLDPASLAAQFTRAVLTGRAGDEDKAHRLILRALSRLPIDPGLAVAAGLKGSTVVRH